MVAIVVLELDVLARHLNLVIVGNDDRSVAVLYHRDLAKHPCVPLLSEGSQGSHEAPGNAASGLATSNSVVSRGSGAVRIKDPPWANHTTAATCHSTSNGC